MTGVSMDVFANYVGLFGYGKAGFNETGTSQTFDIDFTWTPGDGASMKESLAKLGLQIVMEERSQRIINVSPAD